MNGLDVRWECVVCGDEHPADNAGIFCNRCKRMACCSCEREMPEHECVPLEWECDEQEWERELPEEEP